MPNQSSSVIPPRLPRQLLASVLAMCLSAVAIAQSLSQAADTSSPASPGAEAPQQPAANGAESTAAVDKAADSVADSAATSDASGDAETTPNMSTKTASAKTATATDAEMFPGAEQSSDPAVADGDELAEAVTPEPADMDPVEDYLDAIDRVEVSRGAYSPELADLYLGLGNSLLRERKYLQAKNALQRGMQVDRVNNGLNSLSQVPYLFSLASLDDAMGDTEASNQAMNHLFQINSETYGPTDERMLPVLDRMLTWYLSNYPYHSPREAYLYLVNSEKLANHMALIHTETLGLMDSAAPESFRNLGVVEFALARYVNEHGIPGERQEMTYSFGQPPNQLIQREAVIDRFYRRGRDAMESALQLLNHSEDAPRQQLIAAICDLGDWYTAFDKYASAEEHYQLAHRLLSEEAGDDDAGDVPQQLLFAEPVLIDFQTSVPLAGIDQEDLQNVNITLDISERGVPDNLRFDDAEDTLDVRERRKIKRWLLGSRFRPRMENGVLVETDDFVYRYPLAREENNES